MSVSMTDHSQFPRRIRFDWIGESFQIVTANIGIWVGSFFIIGLIFAALFAAFALLGGLAAFTAGAHSRTALAGIFLIFPLLFIAAIVGGGFFSAGLHKIANKQVRGEPVRLGDLFSGADVMWPIIGYQLLAGIIFSLASFTVIGVFILYGLLLPAFALIADRRGIGPSFATAMSAVKEDWINATLFAFVILLIASASPLACGLGQLIAVPMLYVIPALAYRDMIGMPGAAPDRMAGGISYGAQNPQAGVWPPAPTQGVPSSENPFPPIFPANPFPPQSDPYAPPPPNSPPGQGANPPTEER